MVDDENEARRALADLRARIAALADTKPGATGRALRALLAGSGERPGEGTHTWQGRCCVECEAHVSWCDSPPAPEGGQPGEDHEPYLSDGVPDDEGKALPAGLCYVCQQPEEAHRPAPVEHACDNCEGIDPPSCINYPPTALATNDPSPVVPDSPDVRERAIEAVEMLLADHCPSTADIEAKCYCPLPEPLVDAVLAVVGQGMTAEPVAVVERIHEDRPVITARVYAPESWKHLGLGTHLHAAVGSGEQGGE